MFSWVRLMSSMPFFWRFKRISTKSFLSDWSPPSLLWCSSIIWSRTAFKALEVVLNLAENPVRTSNHFKYGKRSSKAKCSYKFHCSPWQISKTLATIFSLILSTKGGSANYIAWDINKHLTKINCCPIHTWISYLLDHFRSFFFPHKLKCLHPFLA